MDLRQLQASTAPSPCCIKLQGAVTFMMRRDFRQPLHCSCGALVFTIKAALSSAVASKIRVSTSSKVSNAWSVRPCELRLSAAVARAEALFSRDAISPVNCATTLLANSLTRSASVQDDTMHAPFAAEVEWNVRKSGYK
jgi:hypothetical protein